MSKYRIKLDGTTKSLFEIGLNKITLDSGNAALPWTLTLPTGPGAAGQVLQTDGTGISAWVAPDVGDQPPFYLPPNDFFTVKENKQVLFAEPIEVDGTLVVDGQLIELFDAPRTIIPSGNLGTCRAVSTANITLSGNQVFDGITTAPGNRILVTGQTIVSENGIYIADTGPWTRSLDLINTSGQWVCISFGTNGSGTVWRYEGATANTWARIGDQIRLNTASTTGLTLTASSMSGNVIGTRLSARSSPETLTLTLGGTLAIANGGTGATTAGNAINALLPNQTGNSGRVLGTDGTNPSWITPAAPTTTFLVLNSDFSRTVTSFATVTGMSFDAEANSVYMAELVTRISTATSAAAKPLFALLVPGDATVSGAVVGSQAGTSPLSAEFYEQTASDAIVNINNLDLRQTPSVAIGTWTVRTVSAGTVSLRMRIRSASGGGTGTVNSGAILKITKVA